MDSRLRALCDLNIPAVRESSGRHEYDGVIQDLSINGVRSALDALGEKPDRKPYEDPHDEKHVQAHEKAAHISYGQLQLHRRNPLYHIANADLACYERPYAPAHERAAARRRHLAAWPVLFDIAITTLDQVPAAVAEVLLPAARGLREGITAEDHANNAEVISPALTAHARFVQHLQTVAAHSQASAALGGQALIELFNSSEATNISLDQLTDQAEQERERLQGLLTEACARYAPKTPRAELINRLLREHPSVETLLSETQALTDEVISWTRSSGLMPIYDGQCQTEIAPPARRWSAAMLSWAAAGEPNTPSRYYITPPDPTWSIEEQEQWLALFSYTTLPAVTVHEVAPGHFWHGLALRTLTSPVRQLLLGGAFIEGWAHYVEELAVEQGFRAFDPHFAIGVALEALIRVARLRCSIAIHSGAMTVDEAARHFTEEAFITGPAAYAEALRALYDPTYGRYTWGKLVLFDLRDRARQQQGIAFSLARFHSDVLALGAPPLGLLDNALMKS